ncbi:MAG: TolC family protein [Pirellulaceae bacterium]
MNRRATKTIALAILLAFASCAGGTRAEEPWSFILPEQRHVQLREPSQLGRAPIPYVPAPPTVTDPQFDAPPRYVSLSDAINIGLANLEVVRVLGGVSASSTGRTVYDVAITNTQIDQQRGRFDPAFQTSSAWNRNENPGAAFNPLDPSQALITGGASDSYGFTAGLSKRTITGGVIDFGVNSNDSRLRPGVFPLNPQTRSSTDLSYTQPLWQGGGVAVNTIPIVLARIDTERSFFQYKNSVQNHVQSVIDGYWALVFARTDLWVREQQVKQLEFANERTQARLEIRDVSLGEAAQTRVAYEGFRANLIAAQANLLNREAALRNVLGLPPYEAERIIPVSPLIEEKLDIDWENLLELAGTQRPEIIELKLILEADLQRLVLSKNQAAPQLDGVALYRWNGLEGTMPTGSSTSSQPGQFTDWSLGVNFSVPLGLRRDRALLRQQELLIRRDRANLEQGMHQATHNLAANVRNLEQFYEQYRRFQVVREAASINLEQQLESYNEGLTQFIVVLQAVVDWGNSVGNEASSLIQYNTELARLERETGTILETHGIAFYEERFGSIGPLGRFHENECYPATTKPTTNVNRYAESTEPSEEFFDLRDPTAGSEKSSSLSEANSDDTNMGDSTPKPAAPVDEAEAIDLGIQPEDRGSFLGAPARAAKKLRQLFR